MASRNRYMARAGHRYIESQRVGEISIASDFEFEESDVWGGVGPYTAYPSTNLAGSPPEISKRQTAPATSTRMIGSGGCRQQAMNSGGGVPSSLPVNIPDWSRILREESTRHHRRSEFGSYDGEEEEDEDEGFGIGIGSERSGGVRVPPHEMVARKQRMASFSVYEGVGRTLKGRDLSRVRNAIWAQTGFQD